MKTIKILILFFLWCDSYNAFSQDTIGGYINSRCLMLMPVVIIPDLELNRMGDLIRISGVIQSNCSGAQIAILRSSDDSILITTKDTGQLTTCKCHYSFVMSVKVSATAKTLVFNNVVYDIRLLPEYVNIPDTISDYFTSTCTTFTGPFPEPNFRRIGEMIYIDGMIRANCIGTHIAIVKRSGDSIFVTSKDTGQLATCLCVYNYRLSFRVNESDSILVLNQIVYNLNKVSDDMIDIGYKSDLIDVYYDPMIESLRIEQKSVVKMNSVSIYDHAGCLQLTVANDRSIIDMSGFKAGLYFLDFVMVDNRHITRKIMKN